jgi:hypothetical protein
MPVVPGLPAANPVPPGPNTFRQVCTNALYEINVVAPGEVPDPLELAYVLGVASRLADSWNCQQYYIFASDLVGASPTGVSFLLVPNLSPHTLGPAAIGAAPAPTFLVNNERPVRIVSANVILNNVNPIVKFPLEIRDKDWYAKQRVPTIQTNLPTDLYPRFSWPLLKLFFWPVPNFAYGVEFELEEALIGGATLDTAFAFPPGYELALTLTLAELISGPFEKQFSQIQTITAMKARLAIQGLNSAPPRINLDDFGEPSTGRPRASFNYHTGLDR